MEHILYAEIYLICGIVVGLLLLWIIRRDTPSTQEKKLRNMLAWFLANFAANFLFALCNHFLRSFFLCLPLSIGLKYVYFFTMVMGVGAWCAYAESVQKVTPKRYRITMGIVGVGLLLVFIPLVINLWTHSMFYFDEEMNYHRGPGFHYFMLYLSAASTVFAVRLMLHSNKESDPIQRTGVRQAAMFPLCLLLGWVLCFVGERVPVLCVCFMVQLLFIYTGANNQMISRDALTQVNNRQNLISFLNYKVLNHDERLYLFMVDVDYFKAINDNFGHLEGDNALVDVVNALKKACQPFPKRPYIARYGGDEFIVVLEGMAADATTLKETIPQALKEETRPGAPYTLQVSIGVVEYDPGMTPEDMIARADEALYEIKRNRR